MSKKARPGDLPPAFRRKRKPPPTAFKEGNEFGKEHRFQPGVSGNPEGFSHRKRAALRALQEDVLDRFPEYRESLLVEAIGYKRGDAKQRDMVHRLRGSGAKRSNDGIHQLLFDRTFGKIPLKITGDGTLAPPVPTTSNLPFLSEEDQEKQIELDQKADRARREALEQAARDAPKDDGDE